MKKLSDAEIKKLAAEQPPSKNWSPEERTELKRLLDAGLTVRTIANAGIFPGRKEAHIYGKIKREGWLKK